MADYGSPFRTDWTYNFNSHKKQAPSDSLVALINQLMFGLAIDVSVDDEYLEPDHDQILNGTRYPYAVHYRVHSEYMWGAVAATVCCVLLVLPVYWGFWQLGRKVSLNPFEIAHAFRSPVIAQAHTAAPQDLMKEVGNQEVRYGPVTLDGESYGRFGVAAPQNVATVHEAGLRESLRPAVSRGEQAEAYRTWVGHRSEGPVRQSP